jgi:hypothetical protein
VRRQKDRMDEPTILYHSSLLQKTERESPRD